MTYPDGTVIEVGSPVVKAEKDMMVGGARRWIPDPATFHCMGYTDNPPGTPGSITWISQSEWDQIPQALPAFPSRADNVLLTIVNQGSDGKIYVMAGCQRHWIPDPETFNGLWYDWHAVNYIAYADMQAIPEGAQLPSLRGIN